MFGETTRPSAKGTAPQERKKKVAIYIRVSTLHQIDKDSLPMQRKDLTAYCDLILGIPDYEIFEDAGYSGKNTARPAFKDMMSRIRKREFTHLLVWKIDRISRNLLDFAKMYDELRKLKVTFVSKNEQFDTSTAIGEAMLKIILVFAELERKMTSERVTAAMLSRANNGKWNGGRIPYGYDYDVESAEFSINKEEARICQMMKNDYMASKSLVHTAKFLNSKGYHSRSGADWSPNTVWKILSSPFYAGIYRYNYYTGSESREINPEEEWVIHHNHHPAIFTEAEHLDIKQILKDNLKSFEEHNLGRHASLNVHMFSDILYCGKCGSRMVSTPGKVGSRGLRPSVYTCPKHRNTTECNNPSINDFVVGEFIINYLLNILNAKKEFSEIQTPEELQSRLLYGSNYAEIDHIGRDGLNEFFNLLCNYTSSDSIPMPALSKKKAAISQEAAQLKKEKSRQERALNRLQDLYLYSDSAISEKDFLIRKSQITNALDEINRKLGLLSTSPDASLSDKEFLEMAGHLILSKQLSDKKYIYFKDLYELVPKPVMRLYLTAILDSVIIEDGRITRITFKNGISHQFFYR